MRPGGGAVEPARSDGGQRLYSDAEVEKLRLLRRATSGGRSIGAVAALPVHELARLVREDDEARVIREVTETFARNEGKAPKGWMGAGTYENSTTPDLLKETGAVEIFEK